MLRKEAAEEYAKALKEGLREYKECTHQGIPGNPLVLDEILEEDAGENCVSVGLMDIPVQRIVGTKTAGRVSAFTPSFRPLLEAETEFAAKWISLCTAHLGEEGIQTPIECFEYLGDFYVQEGNKRVSVLRHFGAAKIAANVKRILPAMDDSPRVKAYQEFLEFYKLSGLYDVKFTQPGNYGKLLEKSGYPTDRKWTEEERRRFRASIYYFTEAMDAVGGGSDLPQPEDALLLWLAVHPFTDLKELSSGELKKTITQLWPNLMAASSTEPVVKTEPPEEKSKIVQIFKGVDYLNVAFVHQYDPQTSNWTRAHENGRKYLEQSLGKAVTTRVYYNANTAETATELIEQAVADGAEVVFTTAPQLIDPCLKASVKYPKVRFLNCSLHQPYATVRTYYSRIYEGKFITGAIAGAMSKDDRIGYVGTYPIHGVPASINAFALGAQMTNPRAQIELRWSCVEGNPQADFFREGIRVVSNRDVPTQDRMYMEFCNYGTYQLDDRGGLVPLASPVWVWGKFYKYVVQAILTGNWKEKQTHKVVNYWLGMDSGVIDISLSRKLPAGVRELAELLRQSLANKTLDPFARRIVTQDGTVKNDGKAVFTPEQLLRMDWLCENVVGSIPTFDEILPMSRTLVRELGVYRDQLPAIKEVSP